MVKSLIPILLLLGIHLLSGLHLVVAGHDKALGLHGGLHLRLGEVVGAAVLAVEHGLIDVAEGGHTEAPQGALDLLVVAGALVVSLGGAAHGALATGAHHLGAALQLFLRDRHGRRTLIRFSSCEQCIDTWQGGSVSTTRLRAGVYDACMSKYT
jgi:hypothetical protein